jgi:hypothetical protein
MKGKTTMKLDMYAFITNASLTSEVDFKVIDESLLYYWSKHQSLHRWMEKLYRKRGGSAYHFARVAVALTGEDLDRLEADIKARRLPRTAGFFFRKSDDTERDDDLAFIAEARRALSAGLSVFYDSWW